MSQQQHNGQCSFCCPSQPQSTATSLAAVVASFLKLPCLLKLQSFINFTHLFKTLANKTAEHLNRLQSPNHGFWQTCVRSTHHSCSTQPSCEGSQENTPVVSRLRALGLLSHLHQSCRSCLLVRRGPSSDCLLWQGRGRASWPCSMQAGLFALLSLYFCTVLYHVDTLIVFSVFIFCFYDKISSTVLHCNM